MNPIPNTPTRTSPEFYLSSHTKNSSVYIPSEKQPRRPVRTLLSLDQQLSKVKHETSFISNLSSNYYHSFVHRLFSQFNKENKITLLFDSKEYEIHDMNLKVGLPNPYQQDIWSRRNHLTSCLFRGSIELSDKHELYFYFSFLNEEKTSIEIVDIPFITLSLVDIHQNNMKSFLKGEPMGSEREKLSFDIKYELSSFKIMIEYMVQKGGIGPGKVSIKEF